MRDYRLVFGLSRIYCKRVKLPETDQDDDSLRLENYFAENCREKS